MKVLYTSKEIVKKMFLLPEGPHFLYVKENKEKLERTSTRPSFKVKLVKRRTFIRKANFQGNLENHEFTLAATLEE